MTLQNYLMIVIGEDDKESSSIKRRVENECKPCEVTFVHAPIGSNTCVTTNGLYDVLRNHTSDLVIVVMASALNKTEVENAVAKFEEGHNTSQKPLLPKGADSASFEWHKWYDLASDIVVAKRDDLFNALNTQMTQGTKLTEGERK